MAGSSFSGRSVTRGALSGGGHDRDTNDTSGDASTNVSISTPKFKIYPEGEGFAPNPTSVVHHITKIIQSKFDEPWPTWKKVPLDVRDMWFGEFKKKYCWLPEHEHQVRMNFETRGMSRLKDMLSEARKKREVRPVWLSPETWEGLLRYWASDEFKSKSEQAKKNRASEDGVGSSLHTGGSIPTSEHKRRLQQETGGEVTAVQLFMRTHQKKDKTWIDNKSAEAYEKFTTKWNEIQTSQNDPQGEGDHVAPQLSEIDLWVKENVTKKGRIYGLGSEGVKYKSTSSSSQSAQSSAPWADSPEFQDMMSKVHEQLEKERQEKEEMAKRLAILEQDKVEKDQAMAKLMKQTKKAEKKMNKKFKEMMSMLKSSSKLRASSKSSLAPESESESE